MGHRHVIFVTHEFDPIVPGGAGTVVAELARRLVGSGHTVTVVLAAPTPPGLIPDGLDVVVVPDAATDGTLASFVDRSRRIAEALANLIASRGLPDLIEFHDFDIPAWWTLTHREELGLSGTRIGIRLHGPVGAMTDAMGIAPPPMGVVGELEALLFGMACVWCLGTMILARTGTPEGSVWSHPCYMYRVGTVTPEFRRHDD